MSEAQPGDLLPEHARIEAHNNTVPLNRLSDLQQEPRAEQYRAALLGDTRG